ncbi:hypothetical protein DHEL01_v209714 [Diaporthe helianthi]|uniref:Uncharacterized protein n=1 Tax=Diaporthe helianthi TaxID=158607 RepID=A0A2P5HNT8_DIAHE|nr:hypothetical protein DHEL01_v209714 [Diaporthe helianthi]
MKSRVETQVDRDRLQADLRSVLRTRYEGDAARAVPELERNFQTVISIARIIRDTKWLTHRYSNDAWRRLHEVAERTTYHHEADTLSSRGLKTPPTINLTEREYFRFNRAFLRVEIYLLTKFWTNRQGQRHMLDMGEVIQDYVPHRSSVLFKHQFGSCMRYIFHALRVFLKKMARDLGAPELPTRDDLQWVPGMYEPADYLYKDVGTITPQGQPNIDFARRSVSEEQRFLLWMCESGIGPLSGMHGHDDSSRRDKLLSLFGQRWSWDTVELTHRVTRYDVGIDRRVALGDPHRNRHPVKSLYGSDASPRYGERSSPWACACAFLKWTYCSADREDLSVMQRQGLKLSWYACGLLGYDTDGAMGIIVVAPPTREDALPTTINPKGVIPHGHDYMLDLERYGVL